jgi:predicted Rossmann-fold nucleotide-binding protein
MILFHLKHIAHDYKLEGLLESDPIEVTKIDDLHKVWSKYPLTKKEWKQFEHKMSELIDKDTQFFEYFLENFKLKNKPKKIFEIMDELAKLGKLKNLEKDIMYIYGSARTNKNNPHQKEYPIIKETEELCAYLIDELKKSGVDFAMGTGGGPGQMEHPLKIAILKGIVAIGIKIQLPMEDKYNPYAQIRLLLNKFFTRIAHFYDSSRWNIATQGGFGTFQEIFGLWTLLVLGKVKNKSIIIFNNLIDAQNHTRYFDGFMHWLIDVS